MSESVRSGLAAIMGSKMFAKKMHRLVKKMQDKPADSLDPIDVLAEMARKKGENLSFPLDVETEKQWKALLKKEGLIVVDVYSGWSGPCSSMFSILRKLKLDTNDDRMIFASANADNISQLAPFRNQSEPCYLFIGGGKPVKVLRGSNAPKLLRTIKSEFQHELDCIEGKEKRNLISIKFESSRREKSVNDAIALNQLIALEEKEKAPPPKSPTPESKEEDENEEEKDEKDNSEAVAEEENEEREENDDEEENREKEEKENEAEKAEKEQRMLMEESNVRLKDALRSYTVIAIQSYLLETGAVTEIKDYLAEDFKLVRERYINLGDEDARKLFGIPSEIPDPDPPSSAMGSHHEGEENLSEANDGESIAENNEEKADSRQISAAQTPIPANDGSDVEENTKGENDEKNEENADDDDRKREKPPVIRMIPVVVPEVIIGDTLILLLECSKVKPLEKKIVDENDTEEPFEDPYTADYYMATLAGPEDYDEAVEAHPKSLRAMYGKEKYVGGVWCPRTYEDKRFVMLNYFPQFVTEMLMMPVPDPPKYHFYVYSALFSSEILEHPQFLKEKGHVLAHRRMRIKFDVAEKMLLSSNREGDFLRALKWALTGQDTLVISADARNSELIHVLDHFDPIFSTKLRLEAGYFTERLFPEVEVLIDEDPFPKEPEPSVLALANFVEKVTEDVKKEKEVDVENNDT